jgi:hypothetical protein
MEIKTKSIITKSPKNDKPNENKKRSLDKYKEFLGEKKDVKKSKDKKVFHVTRRRVSPKKIKKIDNNPRDLLKIENDIFDMKSKEKSNIIQMPTQNENLTDELQGPNKTEIISPPENEEQNQLFKKKQEVKKSHKNIRRSISRTNKRSKTRGRNRRVSIKNSTFNDKDYKEIQRKLKEIRNKKSNEIKKELEKKGVKVSGKSNRLLRDIYLYSKLSNINITHEK